MGTPEKENAAWNLGIKAARGICLAEYREQIALSDKEDKHNAINAHGPNEKHSREELAKIALQLANEIGRLVYFGLPEHMLTQEVVKKQSDKVIGDETIDLTLKNVIEAAIRWWESKRPASFTFRQHLENPTINTYTDIENKLALALSGLDGFETIDQIYIGIKPDEPSPYYKLVENEKVIKEQLDSTEVKALFSAIIPLTELPPLLTFGGVVSPDMIKFLHNEMIATLKDLPALTQGPAKLILLVAHHQQNWPYLLFMEQAVRFALLGAWINNHEQIIKVESRVNQLDKINQDGYVDIKVYTTEVNDAKNET